MSKLLSRVAQVADADIPEELAPELVGAGTGRGAARWVAEVRAARGRPALPGGPGRRGGGRADDRGGRRAGRRPGRSPIGTRGGTGRGPSSTP